jgi:proteic killer suppression protein
MARLILRRLQEIAASPNLREFMKLPGPRCHLLKGDKQDLYSADLKHPFRLLFSPDNDPMPRKLDGGIDELAVTEVCINSIEDTH